MNPICKKCNNKAEERWLVINKFWFCPVCKDEVVDSTDVEIDELMRFLQENTQLIIK